MKAELYSHKGPEKCHRSFQLVNLNSISGGVPAVKKSQINQCVLVPGSMTLWIGGGIGVSWSVELRSSDLSAKPEAAIRETCRQESVTSCSQNETEEVIWTVF